MKTTKLRLRAGKYQIRLVAPVVAMVDQLFGADRSAALGEMIEAADTLGVNRSDFVTEQILQRTRRTAGRVLYKWEAQDRANRMRKGDVEAFVGVVLNEDLAMKVASYSRLCKSFAFNMAQNRLLMK